MKIQLIRVGGATCYPSNELNKGYGALYYIDYNLGEDSLLLYTCGTNPDTGEQEPEKLFNVKVDTELKDFFNVSYLASDSIESGVLSSVKYNDGSKIYCGGTYVLSVSDGSAKKHYSFVQRNTCSFEFLVDYFESQKMKGNLKMNISKTCNLNIDSIVGHVVSLPKIEDALELPPPMKSIVKFVPPEIKKNE